MQYKHCKVYKRSDRNRTAVVYLDIQSEGPLFVNTDFAYGNAMGEGSSYHVTTKTAFNWTAGVYNIEIPDMGDFKVTGHQKSSENEGMWKRRHRYTLTLEG